MEETNFVHKSNPNRIYLMLKDLYRFQRPACLCLDLFQVKLQKIVFVGFNYDLPFTLMNTGR